MLFFNAEFTSSAVKSGVMRVFANPVAETVIATDVAVTLSGMSATTTTS